MKRRMVAMLLGLALLAALPLPAAADGPLGGSVRLPDGTVLPPLPVGQMGPSIAAEMLAAHPSAPVHFTPGALPAPLVRAGAPTTASTAAMTGVAGSTGTTLGLAQVGSSQGFALASAQQPAQPATPLVPTLSTTNGPAGPLPNGLRKEVLGFLPYWFMDPGDIGYIRYDLTSTIAYFSIGANSDGTLLTGSSTNPSTGWAAWNSASMTTVINKAHAAGVRVVPTITLMAWSGDYSAMTALLTNAANRAKLIGNIANAIGSRNADGVNIDFEPVPTSLRDAFSQFIRELKAGLVKAGVGSYVTVDTMAGAASWATGYDVTALSASGAADALMVMAYDFSWSGSARAGGVAPITSSYIFDSTDALKAYLAAPVPPAKIIWGIPYYGRTWPTLDSTVNSKTCRATTPPVCPNTTVTAPANSHAYYYVGAKKLAAQYGRKWDATGQVPWFTWADASTNTTYEGYYDDAQSLAVKYGLVNSNNLAGIGIWTLLMDAGTDDLANVIRDSFVHQVARVGGADRYEVSAGVSASTFAPNVSVAYVATGTKYPDALTAGPAAAAAHGPVLLTQPDSLPPSIIAELQRLKPQKIVVVGGPASVSDAVLVQLKAYATSGTVTRIGGADRYVVAAGISAATFAPNVSVAYVATGTKYPDALSAGPAAAAAHGPVLLVMPTAIPGSIATELRRLKPQKIVVVGGPASVSDAVLGQLKSFATSGSVTRIGGADRYAVAVNLSQAVFKHAGAAYVATGTVFPDALSAGPAAAANGGPVLLVTPGTPLPDGVGAELQGLDPWRVVAAGGPASVGDDVLQAIYGLWP